MVNCSNVYMYLTSTKIYKSERNDYKNVYLTLSIHNLINLIIVNMVPTTLKIITNGRVRYD